MDTTPILHQAVQAFQRQMEALGSDAECPMMTERPLSSSSTASSFIEALRCLRSLRSARPNGRRFPDEEQRSTTLSCEASLLWRALRASQLSGIANPPSLLTLFPLLYPELKAVAPQLVGPLLIDTHWNSVWFHMHQRFLGPSHDDEDDAEPEVLSPSASEWMGDLLASTAKSLCLLCGRSLQYVVDCGDREDVGSSSPSKRCRAAIVDDDTPTEVEPSLFAVSLTRRALQLLQQSLLIHDDAGTVHTNQCNEWLAKSHHDLESVKEAQRYAAVFIAPPLPRPKTELQEHAVHTSAVTHLYPHTEVDACLWAERLAVVLTCAVLHAVTVSSTRAARESVLSMLRSSTETIECLCIYGEHASVAFIQRHVAMLERSCESADDVHHDDVH